jgi:L-ascorbate metabolism protein UlaG (beta-lactamase superfamily)
MHLTYLGHSCFKIQDKIGSEAITVATDPYDKSIGLKPPHFEADIVTVSHDHYDHNNREAIKGEPFVVDAAGEYDIKGVSIEGVETYHDQNEGRDKGLNIAYRIEIDDISIVHLGDLGHILNEKQLERLGGADILLIPVGGKYTLDAKKAVEVVSQIEPRIVIPMHYKTRDIQLDIDGVEKFVKELGLKPREEDKLKISKKELPVEEMELWILKS